jgi:hypothetical protein
MDTETFDEARIVARLEKLDRVRRAAFALACADRLDGLLGQLAERDLVRAARDLLRRAIADGSVNDTQLREILGQLEASPNLDEDAIASTVYACRAWLTSSSQNAAWAARKSVRGLRAHGPARDRESIVGPTHI